MHTAADYAAQLAALLPAGALWDSLRTDPLAQALLEGVAAELARVDAGGGGLTDEADPRAALELLPDWEAFAGLPDACSAGHATTLQERHAAVVSKLTSLGGQSAAYFIAAAAGLGYTVSIDQYQPFICGLSHCGVDALNPARFRYLWRVVVPGPRATYFRCGQSQVGSDPLLKISRAVDLECMLQRLKPAHTFLFVAYQGG